jgi:hypothetical protein
MRVIIPPKPEILNYRREARYYVQVEDEFERRVFTVSVFLVKNHNMIKDVSWAPLEAKIVKLYYDFFDDFLVKFAISTDDVQKVLEEATSTEEAFENLLRDYSNYLYDLQVKEIYRLAFGGVNLYLLKNRRVKASSLKERREKMEELKKELQDNYFEDKDIPALQIVSEYVQYKVPFEVERDENGEPLSKFVLINEEDAKKIVEEALGRNANWREYPPIKNKWCSDEDVPTTPVFEYSVLYLSKRFIKLVYNNQKEV